jgi:hypothetical protein
MEGAMQKLVAGLRGHAHQDTVLSQAQALMYRPFEEPDEQHRVRLAKYALATTVTFGEEGDTPVADLEAAKRHGWQVARLDAYPEVFHKERGLSLRPPLAWELELVEGCLRAVPGFVQRRRQDDPAREEEMTVPVASGELMLALSWVVEEG